VYSFSVNAIDEKRAPQATKDRFAANLPDNEDEDSHKREDRIFAMNCFQFPA
jgi:hypothetical protein